MNPSTMNPMDRYFRQTRTPVAELTRHFFIGLFRSESFAGDESFQTWVVQVLALLIAASWFLPTQLFARYSQRHRLDEPGPYLLAYSSDTLWMIILMTLLMAFVTVIEWPALFPSRRDHLVLSPLPLTRFQIFGGKIIALSLFFTLFLVAITLCSSIALPFVTVGRWEPRNVYFRMVALFVASSASGYFIFLALVGLQGLMSLLLPARVFAGLSFAAQMSLLLLLLCAFPVLPYLPASDLVRTYSVWLQYLPPAWFWAWGEQILGNHNPVIVQLAARSRECLAVAFIAAASTYVLTYLRQTRLSMEIAKQARAPRIDFAEWVGRLFDLEEARGVSSFVTNTLFRGRQQKLVFILLAGAGLALIFENSVYIAIRVAVLHHRDSGLVETAVLALPLTVSFFAMVALRRVFRISMDLGANWIFRFLESPHSRAVELDAVLGTFIMLGGILPILLAAAPEFIVFGPRGAGALMTQLVMMLAFAEYLMRDWRSIPFTFAMETAPRHPVHSIVTHFIELSVYSFSGAAWIRSGLDHPQRLVALVAIFGGIYLWMRHVRKREWGKDAFQFAESPVFMDTLHLNPE